MTKSMTKTNPEQDLLPSLSTLGSGFALATVPIITTPALTRDEQHIVAEAEKHKLKIQATAAKTAYAMQKAGELQTCAGQVFSATCRKIDAVEENAQGIRSEMYVKRFAEFQRDQLAEQLVTLYGTGMDMVKREIMTPLPNDAPVRQGLFTRIVGR